MKDGEVETISGKESNKSTLDLLEVRVWPVFAAPSNGILDVSTCSTQGMEDWPS